MSVRTGCSKRRAQGCVKLGVKVMFCLPSAGRRTQLFHLIFTQPGAHLYIPENGKVEEGEGNHEDEEDRQRGGDHDEGERELGEGEEEPWVSSEWH